MGIEVSILRYKFPKYLYVFTIFSMYDIAMLDVVGGTKNIYLFVILLILNPKRSGYIRAPKCSLGAL